MFVTSCSPGPNNVVATHSGFNHGIKKSIPLMLGVIFGFTTMLAIINFGLINIFNIYPIIQKILILTGTIFLIYLAYKISFSQFSNKSKELKPVNFVETFLFQFLNPKGVIVAVIAVSTYTESGINFLNYSIWMMGIALIFAIISITFWTLLGKFMRKFATNEKFIKWFNYVMSTLLISCIATFYY